MGARFRTTCFTTVEEVGEVELCPSSAVKNSNLRKMFCSVMTVVEFHSEAYEIQYIDSLKVSK